HEVQDFRPLCELCVPDTGRLRPTASGDAAPAGDPSAAAPGSGAPGPAHSPMYGSSHPYTGGDQQAKQVAQGPASTTGSATPSGACPLGTTPGLSGRRVGVL